MMRPSDLTREAMEQLVESLQQTFYLDVNRSGQFHWQPDKDVDGADLVDAIGDWLRSHDLAPENDQPFTHS